MTRRTVRRAITHCGLGVGAAGLLLLALSFVVEFRRQAASSVVCIGRGGFAVTWYGQMRTRSVRSSATSASILPSLTEWTAGPPLDGAAWYWIPSSGARSSPGDDAQLVIPWWLMVLIGGLSVYMLLPEDAPAGQCPKCRFDLRQTPAIPGAAHLIRCPECGTTSRHSHPPEPAAPA